jgi:hypothetical protein
VITLIERHDIVIFSNLFFGISLGSNWEGSIEFGFKLVLHQ